MCCFVLADWQVSYLELIHPTDLAAVQLTQHGGLPTVRWQLFPERLEKGSNLSAADASAAISAMCVQDELLAKGLLTSFADSPLVLST